ncbi:PREDICTED: RAS protein activator like-3-like, partial [Mesitornis unicolor]|uniref:RAS protein activator like-3-like n=1 Tax=Mesitornis unicolor TaxID=54374 RepID=UPI000528A877
MEVEKVPPRPEHPTLLKAYKWRTTAPMGDHDPQGNTGSPGSRRWARLQGWKRSYSQPESGGLHDDVGKVTPNLGAPKASTRRSLFRRAFSAPSKGTKETRGPEGGKATLQKYLKSMSKKRGHPESSGRAGEVLHDEGGVHTHGPSPIPLTPATPTPVWDVSNFSLVERHLVLVARDEESRSRTGSSISEGAARRDHEPPLDTSSTRGGGRSPETDSSSTSQFTNGLLWKRLRDRKSRGIPKSEVPNGERLPPVPPSAAELDLTGADVIVRPLHGSVVGERFSFQVITGEGSHSFGCSSLAERDRWIENLRRAVHPNK